MYYPKISIITPSYNLGEYIEKTILSILNQNYPNLEYIIIDGGSSDNSINIIKKYSDKITFWISEPDKGIYDALNKGFKKSSGEIMGWLNADDMLLPGALQLIAEIFSNYNQIEWVTGCPVCFDEQGRLINLNNYQKLWSKFNFAIGDYKWIQQESTYWKRSLWDKAGGGISTKFQLAGDLELWARFFKYSNLYSVDAGLGGYRIRSDQLSLKFKDKYEKEVQIVLFNYLENFDNKSRVKKIHFFRQLLRTNVNYFKSIYYNQFKYPPKIVFNRNNRTYELTNEIDYLDFTAKTSKSLF